MTLTNEYEKEEAIKRTKRLEARVTEKEYAKAVELAETCGLSLSNYIRKCALGQRAQYFADTRFVEQWMRAAVLLIARWNEIQEYITQ